MGYVKQNTFYVQNEKILFVTTRHWISLLMPIAVLIFVYNLYYCIDVSTFDFVFSILILGSIVWIIRTVRDLFTIELGITNKRILYNYDNKLPGLRLNDNMVHLVGLALEKVSDISVKQNIFGRLFNYGTIIVHGLNEAGDAIHFIKNPIMFKQKFNEMIIKKK